jgi:hypothetical protein
MVFAQNIMFKSQFEEKGHTFESLHQNYHLAFQEGVFQSTQSQEKMVYAHAEMINFAKNYLKSHDFNFPSKTTFVSKYYYNKEGYLDWLILELMELPEIMPTNEQLDIFVKHVKSALTHYKLPVQATKNFYFHTIMDFDQ